jgi:8-oxo-dGTP pyrophosphatase MutT (NUDIX family)
MPNEHPLPPGCLEVPHRANRSKMQTMHLDREVPPHRHSAEHDDAGHMRTIPVAAAVIRRGKRFLLGLRPAHKRHGGLWEFPGGKLQHEEDLAAALHRELSEELGVPVLRIGSVLFEARDPDSPYVVRFAEVELDPDATPSPLEHEALAWLTVAQILDHPLAPGDARFVAEHLTTLPESA